MTRRVAPLMVLLALVLAVAGCGGDDETSTVTVTTTIAETSTTETSTEETLPMGPAVVELQQIMTTLGYYTGDIDGVYGDDTAAAVAAMQEDLGVTADGIYGAETHAALEDKATSVVIEIQTVLAEYGYYTGDIDGVYGDETTAAVEALQEDLGVTVNGRIGQETVTAFNEAVASGELTPA